MIKKISAIVLALVLCLSVVIVPASALDTPATANTMAWELKWDKEYYNPGDSATLQVFWKVTDGMEIGAGQIYIGLNSSQIKQSDNAAADVKANSTCSELHDSFYKPFNSGNMAFFANATVIGRIQDANTEEENALYDQYWKYTPARGTTLGLSHPNASNTKQGLPSEDINALADAGEPFISFTFVVADDVEPGTALNAAITSGSINNKADTYFKYLTSPGTKTSTSNCAGYDLSAAVATATVAAPSVDLIMSNLKQQIRFDLVGNKFAGTFDGRFVVSYDNFLEVFGTDAGAETAIKNAGFLLNKGSAIVAEDAKAQVENGTEKYTEVGVRGIASNTLGKDYVMACLIENIPEADKTTTYSVVAYIEYTENGATKYAYAPVFTGTFEDLYTNNFNAACPNG